jgi:hypothetical protein
MKKTVDWFKWVSVSITVASLVTVFWVWPAWNAGSQTWYWGNNESSPVNTMFRNAYPPAGQNAPFKFEGSFDGAFRANEPANMMLTFGPDAWQYQIEWYLDPMGGFMGSGMEMVMYSLTIGRWRGMTMMTYAPFFSAMGSGSLGSMARPFVAMGNALPMTGMMGNLDFMAGDFLGGMVMFMTFDSSMMLANIPMVVPLANTCFITSPLSDPGYPGILGLGQFSVPTLSQWGILVLAILLPLLYPFVIKRRIRIGRS